MTAIAHHPHRVSTAVADARSALAGVAGASLWSMDATETAATLGDVLAAEARLAELKCRLLVRAQEAGLPGQVGATSTANWYAAQHRVSRQPPTGRCDSRPRSRPTSRPATGSPRVGSRPSRPRRSSAAVEELPEDLDPVLAEDAERHLLAEADHFDAIALKRLGRRLLEAVAPDLAEAHEAALLEREERDAAASQRLTMWEDGHGKVHGRFTLDALTGAMLRKALLAFAAPKHQTAEHGASDPVVPRRPTAERMGQAFAELVQRYPVDRLPEAGGFNATVVVTMTLDSLRGGLKAAQLDTGDTVSAALARKLACEAGIIPAVLGTDGSVLDLGRQTRLFTAKQRIALALRQRGCTAEGCDHPPGLTHAHHDDPGPAAAGPTSPTAGSCARSTTGSPTTPPTPWPSAPAGRSPSPGGRRPPTADRLHTVVDEVALRPPLVEEVAATRAPGG